MNNSPVVLFVYARLNHTQKTIEALKKNYLAAETDLIIYSDAPRSDKDKVAVEDVRHYLSSISGFKSVKLIQRTKNYGLAKNIIEGVTNVTNEYGRVIVLEDDIVTSPYFLQYMNDALNKYKNDNKVWHISGWNYPIDTTDLPEAFFWETMNCWGWATWSDRWDKFEKNPHNLVSTWSKDDIFRFNVDGKYNFWEQVLANYCGKLNTWAVFWYATIFTNNGLCLNPTKSLVHNIGNDSSGENCGGSDIYKSILAENRVSLASDLNINQLARTRIKSFYSSLKKPIYLRVINKIVRAFK